MGEAATALRGELRQLVAEHLPPDFLGAFTDDPADLEIAQSFCRLLAERGLLCLAWPEEFGGRDASLWEQTVVREEMWAQHEPRGAQYMGVNWVGPTIMRHGTAEQKRQHLPPIASGEVIWCQGFSEPDAGSDLASLRTAARRDGDVWRISGQKIWTSYATMAQWCFLLARTSRGEKKQQGITVFLVPMSAPGIEVRPIKTMHRAASPQRGVLRRRRSDRGRRAGPGRRGLAGGPGGPGLRAGGHRPVRPLRAAAATPHRPRWATTGTRLPADLLGRWARMLTHCRRARLLAYQVVALQSEGRVQPGEAAPYRIAVTRLDQDSAEVLMEIMACAPLGGQSRRSGSAARWRTTGATRRPPPWPRAASRCSGSCWPGPCCPTKRTRRVARPGWLSREHRAQRGGGRVRAAGRCARSRRQAVTSWSCEPSRTRTAARPWWRRCWPSSAPGSSTPRRRRRARSGGRAVPQRRLLGRPLPGRGTAGPPGRPGRGRARRGGWPPSGGPRSPDWTCAGPR